MQVVAICKWSLGQVSLASNHFIAEKIKGIGFCSGLLGATYSSLAVADR